jgi:nucleotide-binding universal stress UspA family protein
MTPKHLLVHVDSSPRAEERVRLAVTLARRVGATLTGLFSETPVLGAALVGRRSPDAIASASASARDLFERAAAGSGLATRWLQIEATEYGEVVGWTAISCRYADLAILGQFDPQGARVPEDLVEEVLLESGRPVLVLPARGTFVDAGRRVLVAWTGSRDSARALNDALPWLAAAEEVLVAAFQLPAGRDRIAGPPLDVLDHLRAHGIEPRFERMLVEDWGIVDHVLNLGAEMGADLIVTGGYPGRGFPYLTRSTTTRDLLRTMTAPLFLSH